MKVGKRIRILNKKDLAIIFLIPLILFLLFLLPENLKEMLILHRNYSNLFDIFTTNFVHKELSHLTFNIFGYFVNIFLLYLLLLTLNKRKLFLKLLLINLLLIPIFISLIWLPVNKFIWKVERTFGFSGIVSSINGMVVFAYILFLHENLKINTFYAYFSSVFLIPLVFALIYSTFSIDTLLIISLLSIVFLFSAYKTFKSRDKKIERRLIKFSKRPKLVKSLVPILYLIIILFSLALFPRNFIQGNKAINFFVHYIGFLIGLTIFFTIFSKKFNTYLCL